MAHGPSETKASVALLTVSDTRTLDTDSSGTTIVRMFESEGHTVALRAIARDDAQEIIAAVVSAIEEPDVNVLVVSGGTGASQRDITPDVLEPLFSSTMAGFGELFRMLSFAEIGSAAMLSRAVAGLIDREGERIPIFILPGYPNAVRLAMDKLILPQLGHLLDVCNEGVTR
jgi:molybdenum cofactor biosynthesis protein B